MYVTHTYTHTPNWYFLNQYFVCDTHWYFQLFSSFLFYLNFFSLFFLIYFFLNSAYNSLNWFRLLCKFKEHWPVLVFVTGEECLNQLLIRVGFAWVKSKVRSGILDSFQLGPALYSLSSVQPTGSSRKQSSHLSALWCIKQADSTLISCSLASYRDRLLLPSASSM